MSNRLPNGGVELSKQFWQSKSWSHQAPLSMGILQVRTLEWIALPSPPGGIFPTQGSNPSLLRCRWILYHLSHQGSPSFSQQLFIEYLYLIVQMVKNMPTLPEAEVGSLGREDPLEKEMATRSSILAWRIPWKEEPVGLQSRVAKRHDWAINTLLLFDTKWLGATVISKYNYGLSPYRS